NLGTAEGVKVQGLAGDDTFINGGGADTFDGGADIDTIVYAGDASNYLITPSTDGSSWFSFTDRTTRVVDRVHDVEVAQFSGGVSLTLVPGQMPGQHIVGTDGADTLTGGPGPDLIEGLGGYDVIDGGAGNDVLVGGAGINTLIGGPGADQLIGGPE